MFGLCSCATNIVINFVISFNEKEFFLTIYHDVDKYTFEK